MSARYDARSGLILSCDGDDCGEEFWSWRATEAAACAAAAAVARWVTVSARHYCRQCSRLIATLT